MAGFTPAKSGVDITHQADITRQDTASQSTTQPASSTHHPRPAGRTGRGLPPGPRLPSLIQSIAALKFRLRWIPRLRRRYGDTFTLRLLAGNGATVYFTQPDAIRDIFAGNPQTFYAGEANAILSSVMGEHSLLLVDGDTHKRARRMLMPAFSGRALAGYREMVTDLARTEVATWTSGTPLRALDRMSALTLEVILRVVFGITDTARLSAMRPLVRSVVDIRPVVLLGSTIPWLRHIGVWRRSAANVESLSKVIFAEIAQRRTAVDLAERTDVLSQLIRVDDGGDRLTDAELRDQMVTLLLAGHETTATALAWTLHEIGQDPQLRERARQAVADRDDKWLEAAVKESMRLHPVITLAARTLKVPATVGGLDLPEGTTVTASVLLAHADPVNFPEPQQFRPERFLGTSPAPNTWLPFGGGVRRCIGAGFSLMEMVAVLREVFAHFDITADEPEPAKLRNITSVPSRGAIITVHRRVRQ